MHDDMKNTTPDSHKKKRIVIGVSALLVAILAAGGAVAIYQHSASAQLAEAKSTCAQAADRLRVAQNKYSALINGDEYKSAVAVTDKQVEDGRVVTTLAKDSGDETPTMVACNVEDKTALERNTGLIDKNTTWYETHAKTIDADVKNVVKARDAKTLKDTQTALGRKITDAKKLYDASKDKVKDDKTRDALKKQMDAAGKLKDGKDVKKIKDAQAGLEKAMKTVNDSVKAKQDADKKAAEEKARQEAEAQAAAAAAQAQAQQQYVAPQQSYTPTYTVPQQSYTPAYTAPAAPQQSAPQYSAPAAPAQPATPSTPSTGGNTGSGPISGGHGCGSLCTSAPTDTYVR
ncbi:hypothetical protein [Bifidobacterium castoris]|uniref:Colicin transporter n=1 Tax=Bifidobacterium castoris TaxID=2306972 RepID=A0A430FAC9_9BIFI|nr:hypothetical protein [Bifidobacterium castoris]RSX49786.1 colicin transporter [Bifidobacterium castoris]